MPYGLEILNDDYTLQLSTRSPVLVFHSKGTHSTATNPSPSPVGSRSKLVVPSVSQKAVVAIRPNGSASFAVFSYAYSSGNLEIYVFCTPTGTQTFDWFAFDVPPASGQNYGLECYDPSGVLTYQSFANPIRAISVLVAATVESADTTAITAASGRTIAAIQGNLAGWRRWDPGANGDLTKYWQQMRWSAISTTSGGLSISNQLMDRDTANIQTSAGPKKFYGPRNYMIVDVTGL